jgi:glycosyltransferase involved in cell wall biosynthesis
VTPEISIVMPVFNSGAYLAEAIESVLNQRATPACAVPVFELIVVDDHSTDHETIKVLEIFSRDPRIVVMLNQRTKGAAGARNTGIINAKGAWIGFLDSDDIWFPDALAVRWAVVKSNSCARWIGAQFKLLKSIESDHKQIHFCSAEVLISELPTTTASPDLKIYRRPFADLGKSCFVTPTTVLIERQLLLELGMFNERLPRAEDYHLWFRCALKVDLFFVQLEIAFYRIHAGSLTHGNAPRYLHEDSMISLLLSEAKTPEHVQILLNRYDFVMQDQCYYYRGHKQYSAARKTARIWLKARTRKLAAWRELIASTLKIG